MLSGGPNPIADAATQIRGLRRRNPGALGLIEGAADEEAGGTARASHGSVAERVPRPADELIDGVATPEFRRVDERGRYVFVVFERFALRIKDPRAIVRLNFGA